MPDPIENLVQTLVGGFMALLNLGPVATREEEQSIVASGVRAVRVRTYSGAIHLQGASTDHVTVRARVRVRGPSQGQAEEFAQRVEILVVQEGGTVQVGWDCPKPHPSYSVSVRFEITCPPSLAVDVQTSSGGLRIAGMQAPVRALTQSGGITLSGGAGEIDLYTASGGIRMAESEGAIVAHSQSGRIELLDGAGSADLQSRSGGIQATLRRLEGGSAFRTQSGGIRVEVRSGQAPITAVTSSGGVRLGLPASFNAELGAQTSSGGVRCELPSGTVHESARNHLRARIGDGGPIEVSLRTSSGGIRVYEI